MQLQGAPYVGWYLGSAVLALAFAGLAWRRRDRPGGRALVAVLLVVVLANLGQGMLDASVTRGAKLFWLRVAFLAVALAPPAWLTMALTYTGNGEWVTRRSVALMSVLPAALTVALVTPPVRSYAFSDVVVDRSGEYVTLTSEFGPLVTAQLVYYLLSLLAVSVLFLTLFVRARHLYRTQAGAVLVGALTPWAGYAFNVSDVVAADTDLTPILLMVSAGALTVGLYRVRALDPVPAAHESVVDGMGDGVLVVDEDDRIGSVNPAATDLLSVDADAVVGRPVGEVLDGWEQVPETTGDDWHQLSVAVDGETRYLDVEVTPFEDHHGRRVGRLVVLHDVTERTRREQSLARYETVFHSVQDRVFVLDEDGRFVLVNDALASMLGRSREDLEGESFESILADDIDDETADAVLSLPPPGADGGAVEIAVQTADGPVPCETNTAPIAFDDDARQVRGTVGFVRDISKRKQAERDLAETTQRFRTLVEASPLAIVATDLDGRVEVWNPAAEATFGWDADEVVGEDLPVVPEDRRQWFRDRYDRVRAGEQFTDLETPLVCRDGTRIEASVSVAPVLDHRGEVDGAVAVAADVTERKRRRAELERQKQRLEEFASVISHDLRNPMSIARGYADIVEETGDVGEIGRVQSALDRMDELLDDLLTLAREGDTVGTTEPIDLADVVEDAWRTVDADAATLDVDDDLPGVVEGDRSRVRELFENLFRNASEHAGPEVAVRVAPVDGGFAVEDDGPGIPEAERESVLETGYTTESGGTGLGLGIVSTVAEGHGWDVTVSESSAGGARFEFTGVTVLDRERM